MCSTIFFYILAVVKFDLLIIVLVLDCTLRLACYSTSSNLCGAQVHTCLNGLTIRNCAHIGTPSVCCMTRLSNSLSRHKTLFARLDHLSRKMLQPRDYQDCGNTHGRRSMYLGIGLGWKHIHEAYLNPSCGKIGLKQCCSQYRCMLLRILPSTCTWLHNCDLP